MSLDWSFGNLDDIFFEHKTAETSELDSRGYAFSIGASTAESSGQQLKYQQGTTSSPCAISPFEKAASPAFDEGPTSLKLPPKSPRVGVVAPSQVNRPRPLFKVPLKPRSFHTVDTSQESYQTQNDESSWSSSQALVAPLSPTSSHYRSHVTLDDVRTPHGRFGTNTPLPLSLPSCTPGGSSQGILQLRPVGEIPEKYQSIFNFPYFNAVQSKVFDDVFYTDRPLVVGAPTGSGKTALFELAIIRLLMQSDHSAYVNSKVIYMAPIKALCSERYEDWSAKFGPLGLKSMELTGDSEFDNYFELQDAQIILTTPEKWDSMTRRWRDNKSLVQLARLFLIDEVHMLSDEARGATMEAVVSRMKTVQAAICRDEAYKRSHDNQTATSSIRFVAVSATVPNVEDVASWLSSDVHKAAHHIVGDEYRPVRLRKVVLAYPCSDNQSGFKFDLSLNYKLSGVIETYSEQKPTLVFCATRKGTQQAAGILAKDTRYLHNSQHKQRLMAVSNTIRDAKLRDLLVHGVGYHHAGMDQADRKSVEALFASGQLPVLFCTSTLAMGVNLPAHLVIIKSTQHYCMSLYQEYSETQILQMIGRAGRPQYDTSATAVILTRLSTKSRYENLLNGTQLIESSLHLHLIEHLNAEIVLGTISDVSVAIEWLRSTFLYIRVMKNPDHYGVPSGLTTEKVEQKLQELCLKNLNLLAGISLVRMDEDCFELKPSDSGRLMARYCIGFETMKNFNGVQGSESLNELLEVVCKSIEFTDVQLRNNEKKILNTLNKDKNRITIRYELPGKIKSSEMKVNCLIQAQFGCLPVQEFALQQDMSKIFRCAQRVARCLVEVMWQRNHYKGLVNAVLLSKCFKAKIWENSKYVAKQLSGIGPALASAMVNAGLCSFQRIEGTNPRDIERIVNRHPPFGNHVRDAIEHLPKYELCLDQTTSYSSHKADITVTLTLANAEMLRQTMTAEKGHTCVLVVGDADNKVVHKVKIHDFQLLAGNGSWSKRIEVTRASKGEELSVCFISQDWVGVDVQSTYTPFYSGPKRVSSSTHAIHAKQPAGPQCGAMGQSKSRQTSQAPPGLLPNPANTGCLGGVQRKPCSHRCVNKDTCLHECCKQGILTKTPQSNAVDLFRHNLKHKIDNANSTLLSAKRNRNTEETPQRQNLQQFHYTPKSRMSLGSSRIQPRGWDDLDFCTERLKAADWAGDTGIDTPTSEISTLVDNYEDDFTNHHRQFECVYGTHDPINTNIRNSTGQSDPYPDHWQHQNQGAPVDADDRYGNDIYDDDWLPDLEPINKQCERVGNVYGNRSVQQPRTTDPIAYSLPRKKFTFKSTAQPPALSYNRGFYQAPEGNPDSRITPGKPIASMNSNKYPAQKDISGMRTPNASPFNALSKPSVISSSKQQGITKHPVDFSSASNLYKEMQKQPDSHQLHKPQSYCSSMLVDKFNPDDFSDTDLYLMACPMDAGDAGNDPSQHHGCDRPAPSPLTAEHNGRGTTVLEDYKHCAENDIYRGSFSPICEDDEDSIEFPQLPVTPTPNNNMATQKETVQKMDQNINSVTLNSAIDLIGNIFDGIF